MIAGNFILNWRQKANHGMTPSLTSTAVRVFTSGQVRDHCLLAWEGEILVDAKLRGETIKSEAYIRTLTELKKC